MAIDFLAQQHREAEQLMSRIRTSNGPEKIRLLGDLAEALTLHTTLEERYFYPVIRNHGMEDVVDRSIAEHGQVRRLLSEMLSMKKSDPRLNETISRLEAAVRAHVEEEERTVFPQTKERVDPEELSALEDQMRRASQALENGELIEAADDEQVPAV